MRIFAFTSCAALAACAPVVRAPAPAEPVAAITVEASERGRALFTHNWVIGDEWSVASDGLGPHFNATSCVACHAQGGLGGSGASHHNVTPSAREIIPGGFTPRASPRPR